jgi:hypothetical protein
MTMKGKVKRHGTWRTKQLASGLAEDQDKEGRRTNPRVVLDALRNERVDGEFVLVQHDVRGDVKLKFCRRTVCKIGKSGPDKKRWFVGMMI